MTSDSDRPLFTFADLLGLVFAYPLSGVARLFPDLTIRGLKTFAAPWYRWMRRSDRRQLAEVMCRWLAIPPRDAEVLAARWINHAFRHICADLVTLSGREVRGSFEVAGKEHLDRALRGGRGVLLVSMHSFAAIPAKHRLRRMGYTILSIGRPYIPPSTGRLGLRKVLPRIRNMRGRARIGEVIPSADRGSALRIANWLRQGGIAEMAVDVDSNTSIVVPFLNGRTAVSAGALDLARLCRCPVLLLTATYSPDGLRLEIGEPLPCLELPSLVSGMERSVRACPDQWQRWIEPLES